MRRQKSGRSGPDRVLASYSRSRRIEHLPGGYFHLAKTGYFEMAIDSLIDRLLTTMPSFNRSPRGNAPGF